MPNMEASKIESQYIMFKGDPGTRKSTQALSYPKPQLWLSWDKKMNALRIPMRNWGINPVDIEYIDLSDWSAGKKKLEELQVNCKYKTIIPDSLTSMTDCTLRQSIKMKGGMTRASGQQAGKMVSGIAVNELEDYAAEAAAVAELIALTKDIHKFHNVNIILIGHVIQAEYKTPGGVTTFSRTIITAGKKVGPKIPAYCEEVYHFNVESDMDVEKEGNYTCFTRHTGDDFARTTLDLPAKIVFGNQPLYDKWILPAIQKMNESFSSQITTK